MGRWSAARRSAALTLPELGGHLNCKIARLLTVPDAIDTVRLLRRVSSKSMTKVDDSPALTDAAMRNAGAHDAEMRTHAW